MKYNGPKAKKCRRQGMNLYGTDKYDKILQRKPHGPGKSPRDQQSRLSEYGQQLKEKQKARDMYGISERQFLGMYLRATKVAGQTGDALKQMLERRLDNVIYRAGFAMTRIQSRQFVGHGHFLVDGVRVTIPSLQVKPGQVVTVRTQSKDSPVFSPILASHEKYLPPSWLTVDSKAMRIEVQALPPPESAEQAVDMRQIVEFYSRA
ncbi:MAG: 30S ribosomal protein S4 [Candidatus Peribacteraceae bacterium]|nr:30S ribosomal protein S4 [Candidatus Peribacteraceae bacterium]